jgi:hypothetical protein
MSHDIRVQDPTSRLRSLPWKKQEGQTPYTHTASRILTKNKQSNSNIEGDRVTNKKTSLKNVDQSTETGLEPARANPYDELSEIRVIPNNHSGTLPFTGPYQQLCLRLYSKAMGVASRGSEA